MKFLVGSQYFFNKFEDFTPHDIDYLELVDNPTSFKNSLQITGQGKCLFQWRRMTSDEFVSITLKNNLPMAIGKFLVPEFCKEIGFTIDHLRQLQSLVDNLDDKHKYEKIIYDAYIQNNDFYLNNDQLYEAYSTYKRYR
jgi:hypothetical protein